MSNTPFDREAMLRRAKERGGTASMIICAVSHEARNSDLRADYPPILRAFNERFELLEAALRQAEAFIADELECRKHSFMPDFTVEESGYIDSAQAALNAVRAALGKAI